MSADNWAICPQCIDRARREAAEARENVMALYGKVPVEEFDAKRAALSDPDPEQHRTFREDYEFYGAEEGEITASYGGECQECGLTVELRESRRFYDATSTQEAQGG